MRSLYSTFLSSLTLNINKSVSYKRKVVIEVFIVPNKYCKKRFIKSIDLRNGKEVKSLTEIELKLFAESLD